jgi:hypothetical protein
MNSYEKAVKKARKLRVEKRIKWLNLPLELKLKYYAENRI